MMKLAAMAMAIATASATNEHNDHEYNNDNHHAYTGDNHHRYSLRHVKTTPGLPLASLGVFYHKKCRAFPELLVQTPPGACTPFPGTHNYFQLLCDGHVPKDTSSSKSSSKSSSQKDDSSSSSSKAIPKKSPSDSSSKVPSDSSSSSSWSSSSSGGNVTDGDSWTTVDESVTGNSVDGSSSSSSDSSSSSSSSSSKVDKKHKRVRTKLTHEPAVLRLCRDKFCHKCKRVIVTKTNTCTHLPIKNWYSQRHWQGEKEHNNKKQGQWKGMKGEERKAPIEDGPARRLNNNQKDHHNWQPVWRSFLATCPAVVAH